MTKQPTGKTAATRFENFDTKIPTLGQPKVPPPIPKYAMVDRHGRVLEKSFVLDTDRVVKEGSPTQTSLLVIAAVRLQSA